MNSPNESPGLPAIATEMAQVRAGAAAPDTSPCTAASVATVSVDDANSTLLTCPPKGATRKRIRFNKHLDVALLKSIVAAKVHVAECVTSQHRFEETVTVFMANVSSTTLAGMIHPTWKTL